MIGTVAGNFKIIEEIGEGGMGKVYRGVDMLLDREVAIKVLRPELTGQQHLVDRFRSETMALSKLNHPHIALPYAFFKQDGYFYLVTEYLRGETLDRRIRRTGLLAYDQALQIFLQTLQAVGYAHSMGVIHSDLKPNNIMLTEKDGVKVMGFGIACGAGSERMTRAGLIMGTPEYIAPEQIRGHEVEPATDIYALGIILYEMLAGRLPFMSQNQFELMRMHIEQPPPPLHIFAPHIPPDIEEVVLRALAKRKIDRFAAADEFRVALTRQPATATDSKLNVPANAGIVCPVCRSQNMETAKFCGNCGTLFPRSAAARSAMINCEQGHIYSAAYTSCPYCSTPDDVLTTGAGDGEWTITRLDTPPDIPSPPPPPLNRPPAPQTRFTVPLSLPPRAQSAPPNCSGRGEPIASVFEIADFEDDAATLRAPKSPTRGLDPTASPRWTDDSMTEAQDGVLRRAWRRLSNSVASLFSSLEAEIPTPFSPPEAEAPTPQLQSSTIRRHTDISFPAQVPVGKLYTLRVQIVPAEETTLAGESKSLPKPHPHDVTMSLTVSKPEEPVRITVSVVTENFEIKGETHAEIIVPLTGKSAPVKFLLRGLVTGPGRIMVDFEQDGRPIGSVDLAPTVITADQMESQTSAHGEGEVGLSLVPRAAPDVLIKVFEFRHAAEPGQLHFVLSSSNPKLRDLPVLDGDLGTVDLRTEVGDWVEQQLCMLSLLAKRRNAEPAEVLRALADVGNSLYDQLLPARLKDLCWTLRERGVRTMMVLSDDPHIPWELIKPYRADAATGAFTSEDEFWGESFALTHWLRGRPPTAEFNCRTAVAIAAEGGTTAVNAVRDFAVAEADDALPAKLNAASAEIAVLRGLEASGVCVNVLPARRTALHEAFNCGDFDLLHLAAHGAFGGATTADASAVMMDDGPFSAIELSPRTAAALRRSSPLVFFNACHSGRIGFSLTRLGAWGARLVELGCGGFVGALWPVTDEAALAFARAFYRELEAGRAIGEAMQRARLDVRRSHPNDPTWLAYCCFADPTARVHIGTRSIVGS